MMISLSELERLIRQKRTLALNIHFDGEFRVHVRNSEAVGFTCAQKSHPTLSDALGEHFKNPAPDLFDLL